MLDPFKSRLLVLLLVSFVYSCGIPEQHMPKNSVPSAIVDESTAKEAYAIIREIDYLPFAYQNDGCYARALFMAMELAARQIPSSAQFVYGQLRPTPEIRWKYHVAPLLQLRETGESIIIDPALAPQPIPREEWISMQNPEDEVDYFLVPGSLYASTVGPRYRAGFSDGPLIDEFEDLPPFQAVNIIHACQTLYRFLGLEEDTPLAAKRVELMERTTELSKQLYDLNKLNGQPVDGHEWCIPPAVRSNWEEDFR